ncbi:hypothetical protein Q7C_112 [Methylophaga frappieri]|uniref:Uncharacterized protein n=1 Tax=Methylophaga frappieri (strain ATCC BAA-2434 / DSM 25690 / JAM7) TaxID=754477 RepID=I1YEF0_METFJ|nr:hypothetical protein [Methylophaga frappieri]AFJ01293.1 hypothetical protein Q7C_112 [Methylophaga frappieri]
MRHIVGLLMLSWSGLLLAVDAIHTLTLQHRDALQIASQIKTLLPDAASLQVVDNKLILRSDAATFEEVRRLVDALDQPATPIKVSLLLTSKSLPQDQQSDNQSREWSTQSIKQPERSYQVNGLAYQPMRLSLREFTGVSDQLLIAGHRGYAVAEQTRYLPTENGFMARTVLLKNNKVQVDILPAISGYDRQKDTVIQQDILTQISGAQKTWLLLASTSDAPDIEQNVSTYRTSPKQKQFIYLRVDPLN